MQINDIREALRRHPFQPFTVALADGRKFHIPHRDFIAFPGGRAVILANPHDVSFSVVEPLLIVSLDDAEPDSKVAPGDGQGENS
jgi:hypothetical protein